MILGHKSLTKLFPNFEEDIKENGIDLRIGMLEGFVQDNKIVGVVDDEKYLPETYPIKARNGMYELLPNNYYLLTVDREIWIPDGYCQIYLLRSTFVRSGLILSNGVGDNDYQGHLQFGLYNPTNHSIFIGENERVIQALTIKNDGTAKNYRGDYYESTE
jgi:deoxycytidine triphosphate deaminase